MVDHEPLIMLHSKHCKHRCGFMIEPSCTVIACCESYLIQLSNISPFYAEEIMKKVFARGFNI